MSRSKRWMLVSIEGALGALALAVCTLSPCWALGQACTVESRLLSTSPQPLGRAPLRLSTVRGHRMAAWVSDPEHVGILDIDGGASAPVSIAMSATDLIALDELGEGMLLVVHAPCTDRPTARCVVARTLDAAGNPRGAPRSDRLPEVPYHWPAAGTPSARAYALFFPRATPFVIRYEPAADGTLTATTGGGRGRTRGRQWNMNDLIDEDGRATLLAWELLANDRSRTSLIQTGRPTARVLRGVVEENAPISIRTDPTGGLELVLLSDDGQYTVASVSAAGVLGPPRAVPPDRPYQAPSGPGRTARYDADRVSLFFYDNPEAHGQPVAEAVIAPVRRRRPTWLPSLLSLGHYDDAIVLWVDPEGEQDHVRLARVRCAPRAPHQAP